MGQLLRRRRVWRAIAIHELHSLHGAKSADFTDECVLPLPPIRPVLEALTECPGTGQQASVGKFLNHSKSGRARGGITAKCTADASGDGRIHDFSATDDGGDRQTSA